MRQVPVVLGNTRKISEESKLRTRVVRVKLLGPPELGVRRTMAPGTAPDRLPDHGLRPGVRSFPARSLSLSRVNDTLALRPRENAAPLGHPPPLENSVDGRGWAIAWTTTALPGRQTAPMNPMNCLFFSILHHPLSGTGQGRGGEGIKTAPCRETGWLHPAPGGCNQQLPPGNRTLPMRQVPEVFTTRIPFWDEAKRSIWVSSTKPLLPRVPGRRRVIVPRVVHFHAGSVPGRQG